MGKRGPRRHDGRRERNGQLSRRQEHASQRQLEGLDQDERNTLSVALDARERVFGIDPRHVRDQKAGTAVGRYCLQGLITQAQYDAAVLYIESRNRYLRAIDAPPQPGAVDLNATRGRPVFVENADLVRQWKATHMAAERAIREKQIEIGRRGNLQGAIGVILFRDVEMEHCLGDLRIALNALSKHYRLETQERRVA